jgi:PAS domain S-box-containing protein
MSLCKIFGYLKKEDIIGKNVKMLQPKLISDHHDDLLNTSITKQADQISSRERQIFGKHYSGYIFPLWLQIKNLPSLLSGRQFVATFKVEKTGVNKTAAYMLFSKDRELMDISPSCL